MMRPSKETIRHQREQLGLTQAALAGLSGLSPREVVDLEAGTRGNPRDSTLKHLAEAFSFVILLRETNSDGLPDLTALRPEIRQAVLSGNFEGIRYDTVAHVLRAMRPDPTSLPMQPDDLVENSPRAAWRFQKAHRLELSRLATAFYCTADPTASCIKPVPVLCRKGFLAKQPILLKDLDRCLDWDPAHVTASRDHDDGPMLRILKSLEPHGRRFNGFLYRVSAADGARTFRFGRGCYYGFLNDCDYLSYELAQAVCGDADAAEAVVTGKHGRYGEVAERLRQRLPARTRWPDPFAFESRHTAFGTATLVILKRSSGPPQILLNVRSSALAETPGLKHVIPAGTFQPCSPNDELHGDEFSFTENVVREFVEEIAGVKEVAGNGHSMFHIDGFYGPRGGYCRNLIRDPRRSKLFYLGMVVDPLNLKPEVATVLMLHEGFFEAATMDIESREFRPRYSWESNNGGLYSFDRVQLQALISDPEVVPTGQALLSLVLRHYEALANELAGL